VLAAELVRISKNSKDALQTRLSIPTQELAQTAAVEPSKMAEAHGILFAEIWKVVQQVSRQM